MDGNSILYAVFGLPGIAHGNEHSMMGGLVLASIVALCGFRSRKWIFGAFIGGISHVLLDMLVHPEMPLLYPVEGNPFYLDWMEPVSLALLPLTAWLMAQYVLGILDWIRRRQGAASERLALQDSAKH